jgi:hypothetical protein
MNNEEKVIIALLILFLIWIILCFGREAFISRVEKCTTSDGRCYEVVGKYNGNAAEKLSYLNIFAIEFMRRLRQKYVFEGLGTPHQRNLVHYLLGNYNPENIIENDPLTTENTSYVEDKGKVFAICLREKNTSDGIEGQFHSNSLLEFVLLHEMSHLSDMNFGHGKSFWKNFKFLLTNAKEFGMHEPVNYEVSPVVYCGLKIDYNPYYDKTIPLE